MLSIELMNIGDKLGRLKFLGNVDKKDMWKSDFLCDCGTLKRIRFHHVTSGKILSCGCYLREIVRKPKRHGRSRTKEYNAWVGMSARCCNPKNEKYYRYGARGIEVCERWKRFENFLEDMGLAPSIHHSIDRIDNDDDYRPDNCRWATSKVQSNNNSNYTWKLVADGLEGNLQFHADRLGVDPMRLKFHLKKGRNFQEIVNKLKSGRISFKQAL
jgi:hypothetical protein